MTMTIYDALPPAEKLLARLKRDGSQNKQILVGVEFDRTSPSWGKPKEFGVRKAFIKNDSAGKPGCADYITYEQQRSGRILRSSYLRTSYKIEGEFHA